MEDLLPAIPFELFIVGGILCLFSVVVLIIQRRSGGQ